jgi:hypothetical protein
VIAPLVEDSCLPVEPARAGVLEPPPRALRDSALFLVVHHRPEQVDGQRINPVYDQVITLLASFDVRRAIAKPPVHPGGPQIGRFNYVRVRGDKAFDWHFSPSCQ